MRWLGQQSGKANWKPSDTGKGPGQLEAPGLNTNQEHHCRLGIQIHCRQTCTPQNQSTENTGGPCVVSFLQPVLKVQAVFNISIRWLVVPSHTKRLAQNQDALKLAAAARFVNTSADFYCHTPPTYPSSTRSSWASSSFSLTQPVLPVYRCFSR